ncbi:ParB-like nuclease domain protein [Posidoniimonas corsicana]|uniref:ParB-like nuclease domain protein n=1 Tax=Posidoniimonas corsicana TaxID=1938618 RepID=A0A5C5UTI7_9BACT|nr:ParB N-terminal domain-containing protein [Posidoniimonas corsicana]TWT29169.1 ParB-like nuclease domain protein [Posidoniimonas corsicana]
MALENLAIELLDKDADTQARASVDPAAIDDYAAAADSDVVLPPLVVFGPSPDGRYFIGDGWHRLEAYERIGRILVTCDVRSGTERDARIHAAQANAAHGVRRTNADKRRSVEILLDDEEWGQKSSNMIAQAARVSVDLVIRVRGERGELGDVSETKREDSLGRKQPARKRATPKPKTEPQSTSDEDEAFFKECDQIRERATEKPCKRKKTGQEVDPVRYRKAARAAFGAWVRSVDDWISKGNVSQDLAELLNHCNDEIAQHAKESWG